MRPPSRRGFGTRMIQGALAADMEAQVRLDYAPEGLRYTLDAPLARSLAAETEVPPTV